MNQVSLVEQLKELVKAQNASLRHKETEIKKLVAENTRLASKVQELESESLNLKSKLKKRIENDYDLSSTAAGRNGETASQTRILNFSDPSTDSSQSELYCTALSSPSKTPTASVDAKHKITITLSSTPNFAPKPLVSIKNSESPKKTLTRSESRKAKRKSYYELSPDISDKHVQVLENCYGGKQKANHAACVIQQHYRSWIMKRAYHRLRALSVVRSTSFKGHRTKRGSMRSPNSSSEELSPIATLPVPFNLSIDSSDASLLSNDGKNLVSPKLKPEGITLHSPKDEFKAIQTDLNIDANFQPVEDDLHARQGGVSVQHMSEDISSIEISKNLLNDRIGQQMIINEVFQQIMSPRKDSISLSGKLDSFRRSREKKLREGEQGKVEVLVLDSTPQSTSFFPDEEKKVVIEEEICATKEEVVNVCDEKPVDEEKIADSDESLLAKEPTSKASKEGYLKGKSTLKSSLSYVKEHLK